VITRIWADLYDIWLALAPRLGPRLGPLAARVREFWRTAPGDLIGRAVLRACGDVQPTREVPLPAGPPALLAEDPRLARYLDNVPLTPYAQTLGRYIVARERLPDSIIRHELEHVRQWSRLGPLYLPAYGASSFIAILAGRHRYFDNIFEIAARSREPETWLPRARDLDSGNSE
jgi:hypothetical protein